MEEYSVGASLNNYVNRLKVYGFLPDGNHSFKISKKIAGKEIKRIG